MASHRRQPGQFMYDLRSTKWRWDKFFPSTSVFPYPNHSTNILHSSSSIRCSYQKNKRAKPGNLRGIKVFFSEVGEHWTRCCQSLTVYNLIFKLQSSWLPIHPPPFHSSLTVFFFSLPLSCHHRLSSFKSDLYNSCLSILIFNHETVNALYG